MPSQSRIFDCNCGLRAERNCEYPHTSCAVLANARSKFTVTYDARRNYDWSVVRTTALDDKAPVDHYTDWHRWFAASHISRTYGHRLCKYVSKTHHPCIGDMLLYPPSTNAAVMCIDLIDPHLNDTVPRIRPRVWLRHWQLKIKCFSIRNVFMACHIVYGRPYCNDAKEGVGGITPPKLNRGGWNSARTK